jgi:hypothetical protein
MFFDVFGQFRRVLVRAGSFIGAVKSFIHAAEPLPG